MSAELIGILTVGVAIIAVVAVLFQRLESRLDSRIDRLETAMVEIRERLARVETKMDSLERWAFQGMPEPPATSPATQSRETP